MKLVVLAVLEILVIGRVILRPHREPASRIAWIAIIALLPGVGILAYLLLGETTIGPRQAERLGRIQRSLPPLVVHGSDAVRAGLAEPLDHLTRVARSITGFDPVGGNRGRLLEDSNASIDALVADIDAARRHVHVLFYIWLTDNNGRKVADALVRAARRGVACRALVDGLGSRPLLKSDVWKAMDAGGVRLGVALRIGSPLRRIDLRNHRKIVVIDDWITYCGSQNCADPEFRIKAKFAPWVDAMIRFEGPVARQNQQLFVTDWMEAGGDDIGSLLGAPPAAYGEGFVAQVIGTGPAVRASAMSEMFVAMLYAARSSIVISTPYYVPDDPLQRALCDAGHRGVDTTMVVPARNDSWIVGAASRSYYAELLTAGVKIYEYVGGLLHTKSLTLDEDVALIGSANMDRRSFDLDYENNILFQDAELAAAVRERQRGYLARSRPVTLADVDAWSLPRVFWNNAIAMMGPVL
jgi:cardiolipin synthase A/B